MSMKIMKKAIVSSIGAAALLGAASAQAQFTTIDPVQSEYTFSGATQLTQFGVPANCTLNLVGEVVITGSGGVTIDVTGGAVTGSGFGCGSVTLSNFPDRQCAGFRCSGRSHRPGYRYVRRRFRSRPAWQLRHHRRRRRLQQWRSHF
ncbi:hypothetical protein HML84_05680 [Alcanivorax sp. IO_7]|nr:hypothetical protein HML84_05680 [Alcanivorax sp. IO_7]